ncbi:hypothetical protein [Ferrimonas lipolytica]|uniref:DUF998 domain-containing protein n=1 Tax=Ferrimonas lipolytica TaxID=2724191 RepID=A0A6H1UGS5_9GAMM|nr:hypothetical protein [Ferrimonas lipolytica]QIZ77416.1 hypothetical protein HER31_11300 [Ferrimonas lipolytica]
MTKELPVLLRFSHRVGLFGLALIVITCVIAAIVYRGDAGENFSFLTHTLSELGRYRTSEWALLANGGLFFGGLSLVASFAMRLWLVKDKEIKVALYLSGIVLSLIIAGVGLFPINVGSLHAGTVVAFYLVSPICAVLYCVSLWREKAFLWGIIPAVLTSYFAIDAFSCACGELLLMDRYAFGLFGDARPDIWWPAARSWLLLFSVGGWLFFTLGVLHRDDE